MKYGNCVICGEYKRIRAKNKCCRCYEKEKSIFSRNKKLENHKCLDCGKPVKVEKCPYCKKPIKYYRRCRNCLIKVNVSKTLKIKTAQNTK